MPIKIKPSEKIKDRATGKTSIKHYYAKNTSTPELENILANEHTRPKIKQKIRNELTRRSHD